MYSKHVWFEKSRQAEIFTDDSGALMGTIIAYEGAVFLVNPRSEVLSALYQESRLRRVLGLKGIVLTSAVVEYARGACSLINYARVLGRKLPLQVISPVGDGLEGREFLERCYRRMIRASSFELTHVEVELGRRHHLGSGVLHYDRAFGSTILQIENEGRGPICYVDDGTEGIDERNHALLKTADLVIRTGDYRSRRRPHLPVVISTGRQ